MDALLPLAALLGQDVAQPHPRTQVQDVIGRDPRLRRSRVGAITDDRRQGFALLSDVLGASIQTITINHPASAEVTESTVLGPFFTGGSPKMELGGDVAGDATGQPCSVEGRVTCCSRFSTTPSDLRSMQGSPPR